MQYSGLTWDHPRGYNALAAAERAGGPIHWDVQSLEGFESAPIADLCSRYDLLVLDHPHLGEALASNCLQPLQNLLSKEQLKTVAIGAVGPSYESYTMAGQQWALPLDAATQVMALRPDLIDERPETWEDVLRLSKNGKVAVSEAGPHALLSLLSVASAVDTTLTMADGGWPNKHNLQMAAEILADLMARSPKSVRNKNPIAILNHMSQDDDVTLVPLIYGYVNYSNKMQHKPIQFHNAPRYGSGVPGSIIGGTGIAISTRAKLTDALRDHLLWLMSPQTQKEFIPANDGQPGLECAWQDSNVNAPWGGFYENTIKTLQSATIRPRHKGYIPFQSHASAYLRDAFSKKVSAAKIANELTDMFERSQTKQRIFL